MPGSLGHLTRRFLDVLTARGLSAVERETVEEWLSGGHLEAFLAQPRADQRHGYQAGMVVLASGVKRPEVVQAAMLHDVGKRHARLGLIGRTVASIAIKLSLPLGHRMTTYRDHGLVAAMELGELGSSPLVIDFALHHHGKRPSSIDAETWDLLQASDQPAKTLAAADVEITSSST